MKRMKFYKYQGAGNDFLIADNRDGSVQLDTAQIAALCDRRYGVGADGLMLLESSTEYDFRMVYYNSDGSGGMMCGNGGRCMVAFAADRGITHFDFDAADGFHTAEILSSEGPCKVVRLKMKDVHDYEHHEVLAFTSYLTLPSAATSDGMTSLMYEATHDATIPVPQAKVSSSTPFSYVRTLTPPSKGST